jgi:hypothetical protein
MNDLSPIGQLRPYGCSYIFVMTDQLASSKTFKIRKTMRVQRTQEAQEQEEVANLKDLRLSEADNGHPN